MAKLNMETAIKRYNDIMGKIGYEHNQIGTCFSEDTDDWNLRDMVAELDYVYSCYFEEGHCNGDMRYSDDPDERRMWRNETARIKRFIDRYAPYVKDMTCAQGHCSSYDNHVIRLRAN